MAEQTNDLKLFKYNTATDGKEVFSIERSMNENWDKIDAFSSAIKSLSNLDEVGEKRFTDINTALSKKLEAEVLLAENGYIKFNNKVLLQWITITNNGKDSVVLTFPKSFTNRCVGVVGCDVGSARYSYAFSAFTTTSVTWLKPTYNAGTRAWIFGF